MVEVPRTRAGRPKTMPVRVQLNIGVSLEHDLALKQRANMLGVSQSELIRRSLDKFLGITEEDARQVASFVTAGR